MWDKSFMLQQHCETYFKVLKHYIEKLEPNDKYIKKCELNDLCVKIIYRLWVLLNYVEK